MRKRFSTCIRPGFRESPPAATGGLSKVPLVGNKVKGAAEDVRARLTAFGTLWGMPFAMVEGFNRRLTFIAAWNMAIDMGEKKSVCVRGESGRRNPRDLFQSKPLKLGARSGRACRVHVRSVQDHER